MPETPECGTQLSQVADIAARFGCDGDIDELIKAIFEAIRNDGLVLIRNLPRDPATLLTLARKLGRLQPATSRAASATPGDLAYWIGNLDAHETERWWGELLPLHTAGANEPTEPKLHMMLMLDAGSGLPDADGNSGQSLFSRVDDAIEELGRVYPERAEEFLDALLHTAVTADYIPYLPPRPEPILRRSSAGGWTFRYWIDMQKYARRDGWSADELDALDAFDAALNAVRVQLPLHAGDLVVVDNHRVAHGRMPFPREQIDGSGHRTPSTRRVYNVHLEADI
ncbi:TauD/TfdA family dioxygenase [Micromonospora sp. CA-249363]|uniref:TauD/TfdA family dioxygenase n=1 Tax=Micromonospora sp. CA-249363 TaxID=3239963 RepID=UPI003D904208